VTRSCVGRVGRRATESEAGNSCKGLPTIIEINGGPCCARIGVAGASVCAQMFASCPIRLVIAFRLVQ
jgi:hypothetical protein